MSLLIKKKPDIYIKKEPACDRLSSMKYLMNVKSAQFVSQSVLLLFYTIEDKRADGIA